MSTFVHSVTSSQFKRCLSMVLCICMVLSMCPIPQHVHAEGVCEHHPVHTADCGYVEAVTEKPCQHTHDGSCGYQKAQSCSHSCGDGLCGYQKGQKCGHVCGDGLCNYREAHKCVHVCGDGLCNYREARPCGHTCGDGLCNYREAVPCDHVCGEECAEGCIHSHDDGTCSYRKGKKCDHEHSGDCGYREARDCDHSHSADCQYQKAVACDHVCSSDCGYKEAKPCDHSHSDACGYKEARDCAHTHDEYCGYVKAVKGHPCEFYCKICNAEPTQPEETKPTQPEETKPTQPEETKPTQPEETKPTQPEETQATQPEETQATQPEETQATQPEETQATQPEETQATQPEETQATQPEETQATQPEETQATQPEETQATEPEETQATESAVCSCTVKCAEGAVDGECPVCAQDITLCEGVRLCAHGNEGDCKLCGIQEMIDALLETSSITEENLDAAKNQLADAMAAVAALSEDEKAQLKLDKLEALSSYIANLPKLVTGWQWVDEEEYINPKTNELLITFASIENPVYLWSVLEVLPAEILATVDGEAVELTLGQWKCEDYPTAGGYEGSYVFETTLPEGYVLAEDVEALKITVVFDSIGTTLEEDHTHSYTASYIYVDNDNHEAVCSCGATEEQKHQITTDDYVCPCGYSYYLNNLGELKDVLCQFVTTDTETLGTAAEAAWYVVEGNVTIPSGVNVNVAGDVNLILANNSSLTVTGGISINSGKCLTIYAQSKESNKGSLTAGNTADGSVGIGGSSASLIIYGGTVTATGSLHGISGSLTIQNNSVVTAKATSGCGIDGSVTVGGGTLTASGNGAISSAPTFQGNFKVSAGASVDSLLAVEYNSRTLETYTNNPAVKIEKCEDKDHDYNALKPKDESEHDIICTWCGDIFTSTQHMANPNVAMETTPTTHSYTCYCGQVVTEAHDWDYRYNDANTHNQSCSICNLEEHDIDHDFTSGDCVCGAVQVSYADATGAVQGTVVCMRLSNAYVDKGYEAAILDSGWYLVDSAEGFKNIYAYTDGEINLILENGCNVAVSSCTVNGASLVIWQQARDNVGKLVISSDSQAIHCSTVTINGGVLELKGDDKAFGSVPTLGSGMKLSEKDASGNFVPVSIADRTSKLSTATELKLEPCTHTWGSDDDNEYIDSSYHGVRCQYCGIGGTDKVSHDFGTTGICECGAVKFLDANGAEAVQLCQVLTSGTGNISDGWYVVKEDVEYTGTISGKVHLVLANDKTLTAASGLTLAYDANLTVYAQSTGDNMGQLIATSTGYCGIGNDENSSLTVTGGKIKATGNTGITSRITITGGSVEAESKSSQEGYWAYNFAPKYPVGMRVVDGTTNAPVDDPSAFLETRPKHVIIQPCTDHSVTKGDEYQDDTCHSLVCAYCDLSVEGTADHVFNEKGICNCGAVQYLDENGVTKTQLCQKFTGAIENGGWYVLDKDYSNQNSWTQKDANLILAKGVTLNSDVTLYSCTLKVYGQPGSVLNIRQLHAVLGSDAPSVSSSLSILSGVTQIGEVHAFMPVTLTVNGGILSVDTIVPNLAPVTVDNQKGIYLRGDVGQVAGDFTLSRSFTLNDGQTLTIPQSAKLTTGGNLTNGGTIYVDGTLEGEVSGTGTVYYLVTLPKGVTAMTDGYALRTYDDKLYAKAGQTIVLSGADGYKLNGTSLSGNTFTMEAKAATVEVHIHSFDNGFCTGCDGYDKPNQDASGVYLIDNAGKLFWFADFCNKNDAPRSARLLKSIEIPQKADGSTRQWTPIGTRTLPYTGSFDGQGFTISGLYFKDSNADHVGLFGYVNLVNTGDSIQNVTVEGEFTGNIRVGGICGYLESGTIRNCQNQASVNAVQTLGGICGKSEGTIERCHNSGTITASAGFNITNALAGGICGQLNYGATLRYCSNSGIVTGSGNFVGGIAGSATSGWTGELTDCWNSGNIGGSATKWVGGIIGKQFSSSGTVENCYSYGKVSAYSFGGPICSSDSKGTLDNCFYLEGTDSFDGTTAKTAAQFASGEVAYLLNGNGSTLTWIQNLSGENQDSYPRLGSDEQYKVYKTDYCPIYSNDPDNKNPHTTPDAGTTVCPECGFQFPVSATVNGVTSYYETFPAAYRQVYLNGNGTLTLLADVKVSEKIEWTEGIFNLDLNGKTLYVNTNICVDHRNTSPVLNVQGTGSLNLATGSKLYASGGTVNIQGGTITGNIQLQPAGDGTGAPGELNISGGSLESNIGVYGSSLNISGGSVTGNITLDFCECDIFEDTIMMSSSLTISGGTFSGKIEDYDGDTYFNITGGEFVNLSSNKQLVELLEDGYWFYSSRSGEEGSYSGIVQYSELEATAYTGTLYVGPHTHKYTYTITDTEHSGTCECGKVDAGAHSFPTDSNGFCDVCDGYEKPNQDASGVYQISNAGQLFWFAAKVNSGYTSINGKLVCDDTITIPEGKTWEPIGSSNGQFAGSFNGNGKTISGLNINNSSKGYVGLFGCVGPRGSVSNLTVVNSSFYGKNFVGGICGNNFGSITGCTSIAAVSGTQNVGGICGNNVSSGKITDCSNRGAVSGNIFVGGICGVNSGSVKDCFNTATIKDKQYLGSICGDYNKGSAVNCYYLASSGTDSSEGTAAKTAEDFASGEVAYLLNAGRTPAVWGQNLAEGSADAYPVLNGEPVAQVKDCAGTVKGYTNADSEVTLPHEVDETGKCSICNTQFEASVTERGTVAETITYYADFKDACEAADDAVGSTLKLLTDVTTSYFSMPVYGKFTLDLNGKSLDLGNFDVNVYNDLTITGGEGSALKVNALQLDNHSTLNIQGGSITGSINPFQNAASGSLNITGGSLTGNIDLKGVDLTVSGGSITGNVKVTDGTLTISGGSFNGKIEDYGSTTRSVTGGKFTNLSANRALHTLPAENYWFYYIRNVDEEGNVTYENPVPYSDMGTTGENGNEVAGPVYVGPHEHENVFTSIDTVYHNGECSTCKRPFEGGHYFDSNSCCSTCGAMQVKYKALDGVERTAVCFPITEDTKELTASPLSWYVVKDDVTINRPMDSGRVTVNGTVNLILMDGKSLTINGPDGGLQVTTGQSLNIWSQTNGTGSLICENTNWSAGIGGTKNGACGSVTINGGNVTASGGGNSAGIGGSGNNGSGYVTGTIQINGGTVKATGGSVAPGIGGGRGRSAGRIVINGGFVTATGKDGAPGIGGGLRDNTYIKQDGDGGNVTISNATVIANGIGGPATGGSLSASNSVIITDYTKHQINTFTNSVVFMLVKGAYAGEVYGNVTLNSDLTLDTGKPMTLNMSFNGNVGSLTLTGGAKLILGSGTTLKLSGNGSFPNGVSVTGGTLLNILADGWAFFSDEGGNTIIPLSATQYTTVPETDESPLVYLRAHTHSWSYSDITEDTHTKKCACMSESVTEAHTKGSDGFCTGCGAGVASYVDAKGNDRGEQACFAVTASGTTWGEAGKITWYVVKDDQVDISDRINVKGDVNLILADGCQLNAQKGIHVAEGTSLTIWCQSGKTGTLDAQPSTHSAGIGGQFYSNAGTITINGGNITARGGWGAAGIGGGYGYNDGYTNGSGGTITINNGTVTAYGGASGAGIGGGARAGIETFKKITISGGTVTAYGGEMLGIDYAEAAVGIGPGGGDMGSIGQIIISGGTVISIGGSNGEFGDPAKAFYSSAIPVLDGYDYRLTAAAGADGLNTSTPLTSDKRADAFDGYSALRIEPCGTEENAHSLLTWKDGLDGIHHVRNCEWCGDVGETQAHTAPDEDGKCSLCQAEILASVEKEGEPTSYYTTMDAAFQAAKDKTGSTLKLQHEVTESEGRSIGGEFTLDLNGFNLTLADGKNYSVEFGANVTIQGNGSMTVFAMIVYGSLTIQSDGVAITDLILIQDGGVVTVSGGKVEEVAVAAGYDHTEEATLKVTGGTVGVIGIGNKGKVEITGGKVTGNIHLGGDSSFNGSLTIKGGTIESEALVIDSDRTYQGRYITISGGSFTSSQFGIRCDNFVDNDYQSPVSISGGSFCHLKVYSGFDIDGEILTLPLRELLAEADDSNPDGYWFFKQRSEADGTVTYSDWLTEAEAEKTEYTGSDTNPLYVAHHSHTASRFEYLDLEEHEAYCYCGAWMGFVDHTPFSPTTPVCPCGYTWYLDGNGTQYVACTILTEAYLEECNYMLNGDKYVVQGTVNAEKPIQFNGGDEMSVMLILADGCQLNANDGIQVSRTLNIYSQTLPKVNGWNLAESSAGKLNAITNSLDVPAIVGNVNIYGGAVIAEGYAGGIGSLPGYGNNAPVTIAIYDGYVKATGKRGAGIGGGGYSESDIIQVTIDGGTVVASSDIGAGIGSGESGNQDRILVSITGGDVYAKSSGGSAIGLGFDAGVMNQDIRIQISGGNVTAISDSDSYRVRAFSSTPDVSRYLNLKLSTGENEGGLTAVDYSARTADGYNGYTAMRAVKLERCESHRMNAFVDNEDGATHQIICAYCGEFDRNESHCVPEAESGRCSCGAEILASVTTEGGSPGYYSDFLVAFDAANGLEGSTLKLLADVYAKNMLEVSGSFTLDLNGKTLSSDYFKYGDQNGAIWDDNGAICVPYDCSLTIQDSSEKKTGGIYLNPNPGLDDNHKNALAVNGGTLNFSGGSVNYRIRNELGTLNISGSAKVEVGRDDTAVINVQPYYPTQKSRTVISGGTLIGGTCINAEGDTEVEITGGTFIALAGNSDDYSSCVNCVAGGSVTVSGGTFMKEQGDNVYTFDGDNISVSGGEFIDGISVWTGQLKDRLAKDENGEIAYWYYQKLENGVYSGGITAANAEAASYGSTVYVGRHEHDYVSYGNGTCVCGKQIPVKMSLDGEYVEYFDSLDAALEYLQSHTVTAECEITLRDDVSYNGNLVIPEKVKLEVNSGVTLSANNVYVRGELTNNGTITGGTWYLLELTDCTASSTEPDDIVKYDGSTYAKSGTPISLTAVVPEGKMHVGWNGVQDSTFQMPPLATKVKANFATIVANVTIDDVTTSYIDLFSAFNDAKNAGGIATIELKADVELGDYYPITLDNGNVIFKGGEYTISGKESAPDWENRRGYIGVRSGAELIIESGTIASSAFLYCGSGSNVTVNNGSIHTLVVEGGRLTVEPAVDVENNPVGDIQVENLEVRGFSVGDVQLKGGSYGAITVPSGKDVSDLLAEGYAYKVSFGDGTYTWEDADNDNYTNSISSAQVLPVPVKIVTEPQDQNITYGDNESLTATANREEASYQWYDANGSLNGETSQTLSLNKLDAKKYTFYCVVTVDGYNAKSSSATVTVNPRTLDIQWDGNTFQYDGQYHPTSTIGNVVNGDQVFPVIQTGNERQKNVGSYTVIVTNFVANGTDGLSKNGNYKLGGTTSQSFSITAKPITVTITSKGGTYGGKITAATAELDGVVTGETVPVTLTYTGNGYNSTTAPTDAGTYTVTASISNRNYQLTGTTTAEFVVNKADNSWTTEPSVSDWTYGDSSTVDPGAAQYGDVQVTYYKDGKSLAAAPTNAGSYKVRFTVEGTDNYNELTKELPFTIEQRKLTIIGAKVHNDGRAYDGTEVVELESFTYSNVVTGDTVRVGIPDNGLYGTLNSANAATYSQVTLPQNLLLTDSGDGSAKNYDLVMPTGPVATNVTISKKSITVTITPNGGTYGGTINEAVAVLNDLVEKDQGKVPVTLTYTGNGFNSTTPPTNAGTYTVTATISDSNYQLTGTTTANFEVKQATNSWKTEPTKFTTIYGTAATLPSYEAAFGNDTVEVTYSTDGTEFSSKAPTNAGSYKARFHVAETTNYGELEKIVEFIVAPKMTTIVITPGGGTYGGTITPASAVVQGTVGNDVVKAKLIYTGNANDGTSYNSETAPKKAGTYTVTALISENNYTFGNTTAAFVVERATVTTPTVESKIYNGNVQTATVPASDRYTVTTNKGGTNVGEYDVVLSLTDSNNYQWDVNGGETKFSITKAQNSWKTEPSLANWIYGNTPSTPKAVPEFGTVVVEYTADGSNYQNQPDKNAGDYKVRFTVNGTDNFTKLVKEIGFTILQRSVTVSGITAEDKTYDRDTKATLAYTGMVLDGKLDADDLTATATGTFGNAAAGENKTVTITGITLSGSSANNYCLAEENQQTETKATINKKELTVKNVAVNNKQYDGLTTATFTQQPELVDVVDGDVVTLTGGTPSFESAEIGKNIKVTYEAFVISDTDNYVLTQPESTTASIFNTFKPVKGENGSYTTTTNDWTNQSFVVTAKEGFLLSLENTDTAVWSQTLTVENTQANQGEKTLSFYVRDIESKAISLEVTETYRIDITAPTGTISFDEKDETESSPRIIYKKDAVDVAITGADQVGLSGVASVSYLKSDVKKSDAELKAITDWTEETGFTIPKPEVDETKCFVYAKVVDNAGNVAYFRANQILFDITAPSITGVHGKTTYYTTQTATVTDNHLKTVTLGDETVESPVTLKGDVDLVYIITAEDEAGNISTLEVTMKPIDTLFEPVKDVDKETVEKGDKDDLEDVKKQLEDLPDTATEEEQKKIDDFLDQIEDALDTLDNVDEMEEELQELPDPKDVQPDDEEAEQQIKQAQDDFDNGLTDHEKELVDDELLQKLEDLQKALVDYKIISGDGSVWKRGSGKTQVFIANGQLKKFQTLKLDGKDVSSSDYTLEAGSTVVTFEPAFMQGLKRGSHTIQFIYSDGQTPEGSFEVKQSANYLDLTGNKDFKKHKEIWINGKSYPIEEIGGRYVNLPKSGDLLTVYTYLNGTSEGSYTNYPTSMKVYRINRSEKGTTVKLIPKLNNLLRYSGCSIRVTGKPGIRMITSLTQANKNALTGKGLAGFKLVEYGTVVQWADTLGDQDLTLSTGKHNYAYKKGVADPVYNTTGSLTQYTNVLVGFSKSECKKDIVMRPYIILKDAAGNRYTLYGGCVTRSIRYIAWQNRNTYEPGTDAYNYVHELMGKKKAG